MKIKLVTYLFVIFGLLATSSRTFAHHGTTAYDPQHKVTMKGTVTNFEWTNPHSQIHLDVTDDQGKVVHWNFEAQPPNILIHAGWTRETLKPGDQLTVVVNPAKNGSPIGIIQKIVLANGQELTMTEK
jgi:uncharacterized protein DUF6152